MNLARQEAARPLPSTGFGSAGVELVALKTGLKPLVRQLLSDADLEAMRNRGLPPGLFFEVARRKFQSRRVVFFSFDRQRAREGARLEITRFSEKEMGLLLGFPPCCIAAFQSVPDGLFPRRTNMALIRAAAKRTSGPWAPRLNVLNQHALHYLSHWPCRFDCAPSLAFTNQMADALRARHAGWASEPSPCQPDCKLELALNALDETLQAHRLVFREEVQVSIRGRFEGTELQIESAWPTYRDDVTPLNLRSDEEKEAALTATAAIINAGRIELRDGTLWLGGKAAFRCPGAVLAPFGQTNRDEPTSPIAR